MRFSQGDVPGHFCLHTCITICANMDLQAATGKVRPVTLTSAMKQTVLDTIERNLSVCMLVVAAAVGVSRDILQSLFRVECLHLYYLQRVQSLLPTYHVARVFSQRFLEKCSEYICFPSYILSTDEAYFPHSIATK